MIWTEVVTVEIVISGQTQDILKVTQQFSLMDWNIDFFHQRKKNQGFQKL